MFNNYAIVQGVDQIVPGRRLRPGLPARAPRRCMHAILTLHEKIRAGELTRRRGEGAGAGRSSSATASPTPARARAPSPSGAPADRRLSADRRRPTRRRDAEPSRPSPSCCTACPSRWSRGQRGAAPAPRAATSTWCAALHDDGFLMCVDLTAVDYLTHPGRALPDGRRRPSASRWWSTCSRTASASGVRAPGAGARATIRPCPSLFDLYPGTEAMEREVFDMFGIALRRATPT